MNYISDIVSRVLFVGGHGFVAALDKESGRQIWRTNLKGSGYHFVNLILESDGLYAASRGKVFCLSVDTGEIMWSNNMPGMGYGIFGLASAQNPRNGEASVAAQLAADANQRSNTTR